jgi:hypothetical protein
MPFQKVNCVGNFLEPCFVVRGWVTVYSVSLSPQVVQSQVSSEINAIFDSGRIQESLVDVERIASLRDPSVIDSQILRVPVTARTKDSFPSLSLGDSGPEGQSSANRLNPSDIDAVAIHTGSPPLSVATAQQEASVEVDDSKPFILRLPWWIWLCCLAGVLAFWGLAAALEQYLNLRDTESEETR